MAKPTELCSKSAEFIERRGKEKSDKPFFIYCTISFPHPPYACEDPWYSSIDRKKLPKRRPNIQEIPNKASMLYGINENRILMIGQKNALMNCGQLT